MPTPVIFRERAKNLLSQLIVELASDARDAAGDFIEKSSYHGVQPLIYDCIKQGGDSADIPGSLKESLHQSVLAAAVRTTEGTGSSGFTTCIKTKYGIEHSPALPFLYAHRFIAGVYRRLHGTGDKGRKG